MGELIVIEGADHIGKSSIVDNVFRYLNHIENKSVCVMHFPSKHNKAIQKYLNGDYPEMGALEVAMMFARDRSDNLYDLHIALDNFDYVILDRYVLSNILYQCGRTYLATGSPTLTLDLANNIIDTEYILNGMLHPDQTLFIRRQPIIPPDLDSDDILESDYALQEFVNKQADNFFFNHNFHGKFKLLEADYLDNKEIEELIIGAILNG